MKIIHLAEKILIILAFLILGGCDGKIEKDPCDLTKWPLPKVFEIKLAINVSSTNPILTGGSAGSQKPEDFQQMIVNGTIKKNECNDESDEPVNLGNTYIIKGVDNPAPVVEPKSFWIGHVVFVYEFDNDNDCLDISLNVKITMKDEKSYMCNISDTFDSDQITLVPGEMYYYILIDIYSDLWIKV